MGKRKKEVKEIWKVLPIFILLFCSLFLLSGIDGCPKEEAEEAEVFGLMSSFVENAPPIRVSVNQEFPIYVEIQNKGGAYINPGEAKFYLTGIGRNLEGVKTTASNERSLAKESISLDRIVFADKSKFTFELQEDYIYTLPLVLYSCYNYGTTVQTGICIAPANESRVCSVEGEKITATSNSIAPIQISSLTEEAIGNKLRISFVIVNNLAGQVYLPDADCDRLQAKDFREVLKQDKVHVEIRTLEKDLICKLQDLEEPFAPIDSLIGTANIGKVVCEKTFGEEGDHVSPFAVILRYKYVGSTVKNINIVA